MSPPWLSPWCPRARLIPLLARSSFYRLKMIEVVTKIPQVSCKILKHVLPILKVRVGTGSVRVKYGLCTGLKTKTRGFPIQPEFSSASGTWDFWHPWNSAVRFWCDRYYTNLIKSIQSRHFVNWIEAMQSDAKFAARGTCPNCLSWSRRAWSVRLSAAAACGQVCSYHHIISHDVTSEYLTYIWSYHGNVYIYMYILLIIWSYKIINI